MADFSTKVIKYLEANGKTKDELGPEFENPNVAIIDDGTGAIIKIWNADALGVARPTDEQLATYEATGNTHESNHKVRTTRKKSYGNIGDQLDEIFKDIDAWKTRIQAIKDASPKS